MLSFGCPQSVWQRQDSTYRHAFALQAERHRVTEYLEGVVSLYALQALYDNVTVYFYCFSQVSLFTQFIHAYVMMQSHAVSCGHLCA